MSPLRCAASATTAARYLIQDDDKYKGNHGDIKLSGANHLLNCAFDAYPLVLLNTSGTKTFFCGARAFI
jgi:hypothetical protein